MRFVNQFTSFQICVFDTLAIRDSVLEYDGILKKHIYLDNKSFYWNGGQILGDKHSDKLLGNWYRYGNNLHCCCYIHFDLLMRKGKEHECSRRHLDRHLFVYHASKYQIVLFNFVICAYSSFRPCDTYREEVFCHFLSSQRANINLWLSQFRGMWSHDLH